uniref:Expressed protein n=1 Tax=Oryza sativa subsp. japonica TaxID=39947 RepID=Q2QYG8_ORYSJ|nr:expressed protein [Oryza sativa Japonica Group]
MTTTIAMTTATSTPGLTTRVNTSSPRLTGLDITPAFFLVIRAASSPLLPRILQLLMEKQPSILKLGLGEASGWLSPLVLVDMKTSASSLLCRAELFLMEKTCCCDTEGELVLSKPSSSCAL